MLRFLLFVLGVMSCASAFLYGQTAGLPTVASLSSSQTLTEGVNLTLSVSVNGASPFTYQWRKVGVAISGATNSSLSFTPLRVSDDSKYTVVVTNSVGSITSSEIVIAVRPAIAPTFYYQPGAVTCVVGETLNFSLSVSGTEPMTFVWKKGATTIATTSSAYYSKANVQAADAGTYTLTVTNIAGAVTSSPFTVTVNPVTAPTISTLADVSVEPGSSLYFHPSVQGTGAMTYQWNKDGVAIPGATSYYFSKYGVTSADAGSYTLTVTNPAGTTTSNAARVTVLAPVAPTISSVSGAVSVIAGDSFSLSVSANGTGPLTYQWRKDGVAITGATSSYFSKSNAQTADAGAYTVVVANAQGSATGNAITVAITSARPLAITYHPTSFAVRLGDYLSSLSVGVSGSGTISYQWRKDGVAIPGATNSGYYFGHAATAADAGAYTVVVTNAQGSATSEVGHVTILPALPPKISAQPPSQTVRQGQTLSLSNSVTGTPSPTVQWRRDGVNIPGATGSSYSSYYKANVASSDAGVYSFVATNSAGSATSEGATVTVIAPAVPTIISHPASASLLPGDNFYGMFVEVRSSSGTTTIQWYRNGVIIPEATGTNVYIYNAQPSVAGTYTAVVTNSAGSVTSREAFLTVDTNATRPVFTYVPGGRAVIGGQSASLSISTSGAGETVQWFKDGVIIPNALSKDYSFPNFGVSSGGTYTAQVTSAAGTFTSRAMVLELMDAGASPLITRQPVGQTIPPGRSADFYVTAEGEQPLTYQWRKDGVAIPGATASSYSVYAAAAANAGAYAVVVTNRNGTATSSAAVLAVSAAVLTPPVITQHPTSQTVSSGSGYLSLGVSLDDYTGVTYQWKKDGLAIPSGTGSSLSYYTSSPSLAGRYAVTATNSAGSATSYDALVTVTAAVTGPTFTVQPQNADGYYGSSVTFTSSATGTATVLYQWRKNGADIPGATNSSLSLANVQASDAATYTVVASDANGSTPSVAVTLTLSGGVAPFIITPPSNVSAQAGTAAIFLASVGGTPVPTVQWRKGGFDLPGATNLQLTLNAVTAADAAVYTLVARNPVGSVTSAGGTLTVIYPPPTITTQPQGASVLAGGTATFVVVAASIPEVTYQWRRDGVPLPGATLAALALTNIQSAQGGRYSVIVTSAFGSVTSVDALLTVGNPVIVTVPAKVVADVGGSATLSATVQSVDPLVFRWARHGVFIAGATNPALTFPAVQLTDVGTYVLVVSRPDGTVLYPLTGSSALAVLLTVNPKFPPNFVQQPDSRGASFGETITLTARAVGTGIVTYQWRKNGSAIAGATANTLVLAAVTPADAADYTVVATDANGSTTSMIARVTVTGSVFASTYFGTFPNGDSWALQTGPDARGVFIAILASLNQVIVERGVIIQPDGRFRFGQPRPVAADGASLVSARYYAGEVSGVISAATGGVSGQVAGAGLPFAGARIVVAGTPVANAGYYRAVPLASDLGQIDVIAGPDGTIVLVAADPAGVRGGRGIVEPNGAFSVVQSQYSYRGGLGVGGTAGVLQGVYVPASGSQVLLGTPAAAVSQERLVNVATRGIAGVGLRTLTAGFVISGSTAKEVLIRAVGPGLASFGVTGLLGNPRLRLFREGTAIAENDDWALGGFATQIADAAVRIGAFGLVPTSHDAAVLTRLEPGAYTAQVSGDGATAGVALVEVYDTAGAAAGAPKLVNLSTRGEVGRGGDILIVGLVVGGTAAKKVMIRGIGPGLAAFGVTDALTDPRLQLYQGATLLRENDNWSEAIDVAAVVSTAETVGAFALAPGSKDAALVFYLAPGSYTAQVSGVGNATGIGLVEAYEVP